MSLTTATLQADVRFFVEGVGEEERLSAGSVASPMAEKINIKHF